MLLVSRQILIRSIGNKGTLLEIIIHRGHKINGKTEEGSPMDTERRCSYALELISIHIRADIHTHSPLLNANKSNIVNVEPV